MKKLFIASVYSESNLNKNWIDLQTKFIESNTENYEFGIYLNRITDESIFSNVKILGRANYNDQVSLQHSKCLNHIMDLFKTMDYEYFAILDSDCFPIENNWFGILSEKMKPKKLASVVRAENLTIFPHPCAMLFEKSIFQEKWFDLTVSHNKNLLDMPVYDPCMTIPINKNYPLIRTNKINLHPIFAASYGYLFYHHGCGSRGSHYHSQPYHWGYEKSKEASNKDDLLEELIKDPVNFISSLSYREIKLTEKPQIKSLVAEDLKSLLMSDKWPVAVDPQLICDQNDPDDLKNRAEAILWETIGSNLKDKKFLDYGCGMGHCVEAAADFEAKLAIGYDINTNSPSPFEWNTLIGNKLLTTDITEVEKNAPYDIIMLFDLLDHIIGDPIEIMKKLKTLKTDNGKILIRCHPQSSRHATHLYKLNKAFVHLVFSDDELKEMGFKSDKKTTINSLYPMATYRKIFQDSGFTIEKEDIIKDTVEPFFKNNIEIANRIKANYPNNNNNAFPDFQTSVSFVNFVIK